MSARREVLRELLLMQPRGLVIPPVKFFEPRKQFLSWMKREFAGRRIYDIGAGCGHVARQLDGAGLEVEALDLNVRVRAEFPISVANSIDFEYAPGSVALLCRPCHGPFVDETIQQAMKCGVFAFVYVGLQRNVEIDILPYLALFHLEAGSLGRDGEEAWVMRP